MQESLQPNLPTISLGLFYQGSATDRLTTCSTESLPLHLHYHLAAMDGPVYCPCGSQLCRSSDMMDRTTLTKHLREIHGLITAPPYDPRCFLGKGPLGRKRKYHFPANVDVPSQSRSAQLRELPVLFAEWMAFRNCRSSWKILSFLSSPSTRVNSLSYYQGLNNCSIHSAGLYPLGSRY